jgi:hypothetical protein
MQDKPTQQIILWQNSSNIDRTDYFLYDRQTYDHFRFYLWNTQKQYTHMDCPNLVQELRDNIQNDISRHKAWILKYCLKTRASQASLWNSSVHNVGCIELCMAIQCPILQLYKTVYLRITYLLCLQQVDLS